MNKLMETHCNCKHGTGKMNLTERGKEWRFKNPTSRTCGNLDYNCRIYSTLGMFSHIFYIIHMEVFSIE